MSIEIVTPAGYSIDTNIAIAQIYANSHTTAETLWWFKSMVKSHGPWDYKGQGREYEDLGNWNYGLVGAALGIPDAFFGVLTGL